MVASLLDISKVKAGRESGEQIRHECICLMVERLNLLSLTRGCCARVC